MMPLKVGYVPLTDALPLIVARQLGLYESEGLSVVLQPMNSWAQMRDALVLQRIDAAHCLPGIPLAFQAGLFGRTADIGCSMTFNHFGNAITLATALAEAAEEGHGALLRRAQKRREAGRPLVLASVFPVSKHEFELRHWIREQGLDPDQDVDLIVMPPQQVVDALSDGRIDGFCVGEPWNSLAVARGVGRIVASSRSLDLPGTEKVLAAPVALMNEAAHMALLRCLHAACQWLGDMDNRQRALPWLAATLELPLEAVRPGLLAQPLQGSSATPFIEFSGINRPDRWHANWLLAQIRMNAEEVDESLMRRSARAAFRPDIYDAALSGAADWCVAP